MKQKILLKFLFYTFILLFILYNIYLSSTFVLNQDIGFNTDLARDFLLLQNIEQTHKPPLIGPRSGGISGVFHGPLWIYLNFPAYLISNGNPIGVGWFWIILIVTSIAICFWVGKQLYGISVGLMSALLISITSVPYASSLFNPFGAVLLSPLYLYFLYLYILKNKIINLLIALFLLGLIIQFQVAFGGPLLVLTIIYLIPLILKRKKSKQLLAFLILLIPLSTYILFDIRHEFLQTKSLITYLSGHGSEVSNFNWTDMINNRLNGFMHALMPIPYSSQGILITVCAYFLYLFYRLWKVKDFQNKNFILLFFYFYIGFWTLTFFFRGVVWGYYYWPFLPLVVILIAAGYRYMNKYIFFVFYSILLVSAMQYSQQYITNSLQNTIAKDSGSWQFNYKLAQTVFAQNDTNFGYYLFSPDEFAYSLRYAMDYTAKEHPEIKVSSYQKEKVTYLLISPSGGENNSIGGEWWKENRVKIVKKPEKTWLFENGFRLEKYILSEKEKQISSDPNLINSLIFR